MKKIMWLLLFCVSLGGLLCFPQLVHGNNLEPWGYGKEYPADFDDPESASGPRGELEVTEAGTFLTSLMEAKYGTAQSTGWGGPLSTNNNYSHLSNTSITVRDSLFWEQKAESKGLYIPDSANEPYKGGKYQIATVLPIHGSNNANGGWDRTRDDFRKGNYGLYLRLEFPPGVDAQSMAKCINWETVGASTQFYINATIIPTPLTVYFPITLVPRYTKFSKEDPSAIYILIRGVNYSQFSEEEKNAMTTSPGLMESLVLMTGLGSISGHGAIHFEMDMGRYTGNYSTAELLAMEVQANNPDTAAMFAAVDDSPSKILTRGCLPPHPTNQLPVNAYALPNNETYSPEIMGRDERSDSYFAGDMLFDKSKINSHIAPNNQPVSTWSSFMAPIDSNRELGNDYSEAGNNLDALKSYNTQSKYSSGGTLLPEEFFEVKDDYYSLSLPGANMKERKLVIDHHQSLMTYLDLNNPLLGERGGVNHRFARVVDYFSKTDITQDPNRQVSIQQNVEDDAGNLQPLEYLLEDVTRPSSVIMSGTAQASSGQQIGPIHTARLSVEHLIDEPSLTLNPVEQPEVLLGETITISGELTSIESSTAQIYYSVDGGEWLLLTEIQAENKIIDALPWQGVIQFTRAEQCGAKEIRLKAVDQFGLESNVITQPMRVIPNSYQLTMNYFDLDNHQLLESQTLEVDDTELVNEAFLFYFRNYKYSKRGWKFEYGRLGDDTQNYAYNEEISLSLADLKSNALVLNAYLIPVNPGFEVPNIIDFGEHIAGFEAQQFFPEKIDGKFHIQNNGNLQEWQLLVQSSPLVHTEIGKDPRMLDGFLVYYKGGAYHSLTDSWEIFNPKQDPYAGNGYEVSKDWTYAEDVNTTPEGEINGFSLHVKGHPAPGKYQATINWTVTGQIEY